MKFVAKSPRLPHYFASTQQCPDASVYRLNLAAIRDIVAPFEGNWTVETRALGLHHKRFVFSFDSEAAWRAVYEACDPDHWAMVYDRLPYEFTFDFTKHALTDQLALFNDALKRVSDIVEANGGGEWRTDRWKDAMIKHGFPSGCGSLTVRVENPDVASVMRVAL